MNLVAADVSPLYLDREGSLSRLTSAATVLGFGARSCVRSILTLTLSPRSGNSDRAPQRSERPLEYHQRGLSFKAEEVKAEEDTRLA